jgi:hypothetical protein
MNQDTQNVPRHLRRLYEALFSIFVASLFVYTQASRPFAWPTRYLYFWHPRTVSIHRSDFLLFYSVIFVAAAAGVFLCIKLAEYIFRGSKSQ